MMDMRLVVGPIVTPFEVVQSLPAGLNSQLMSQIDGSCRFATCGVARRLGVYI